MRRWEDVLQTPTIGRTLRSDALGKIKQGTLSFNSHLKKNVKRFACHIQLVPTSQHIPWYPHKMVGFMLHVRGKYRELPRNMVQFNLMRSPLARPPIRLLVTKNGNNPKQLAFPESNTTETNMNWPNCWIFWELSVSPWTMGVLGTWTGRQLRFGHSVMLSSSTVFIFSIQIASTGPSKTVHL